MTRRRKRKTRAPEAPPAHPGQFVRDLLTRRDLTIVDGAKVLGCSRVALQRLVTEVSDLSPEMALRLERAFPAVSMHVLLLMQLQWDEVKERARLADIDVPGLAVMGGGR